MANGSEDPDEDKARTDAILALCDDQGLFCEGETELDEDICVSEGNDNGAYVRAWVWVTFAGSDLDKEPKEEEEEEEEEE